MIKKCLFAVLSACVALPICASDTIYPDPTGLTEQLQSRAHQAQEKYQQTLPPSANSHENGVVKIALHVETQFKEEYPVTNHLIKNCAAVRIAPNYLLASLACKGTANTANQIQYRGSTAEPEYVEMPVAYRKLLSIEIGKETITHFFEDKASKLILIKLTDQQVKNLEKFENRPMANLFVPQDPASIENVFEQLYANRERFRLPGRTCSRDKFDSLCNDNTCMRVCWQLIDADNGDPLFGLTSVKENMEFLIGFNDAEPDGESRGSGRIFRIFSNEAVDFLHKSMGDKDFAKFKRKIVDENFFKK